MTHRGTESPMDFEWQGNGTGPIDPSSPFHQFTMKRTHSQLDGPLGKSSLPSLTEPNGRPWFFSNMPASPSPPQTQTSPFRQPSFTTPRKPFDIDFSSGPESSPADPQANNDDTPEAKPFEFKSNHKSGNSDSMDIDSAAAQPNGKRNSLFGMYGKFAPSPSASRKPFNDALEKRIHKRRRRAQDFSASKELVLYKRPSTDTDEEDHEDHAGSDGENDGDDDETLSSPQPAVTKRSPSKTLRPQAKSQQESGLQQGNRQVSSSSSVGGGGGGGGGGGAGGPQGQANEGLLTRIFTFLTTYPSAPAIIAKYLQILSNVFIFTCVFYLLFSAVSTIRNDIDRLADETVSEILAEMSTCSRNYIENRCAADTRLPALETVCSNWEICMQRDPNAVKRARLSARTLADILNGFVEPISWKTMGVMFAGLVLVLLVTNGTFTLYRRQYEHHHPHHPLGGGPPHMYWPQGLAAAGLGHHQLHPSGSYAVEGGSGGGGFQPPYMLQQQKQPWDDNFLHHNNGDDDDEQNSNNNVNKEHVIEWRRNANASPSKRFRPTPSSPEKKKPRI